MGVEWSGAGRGRRGGTERGAGDGMKWAGVCCCGGIRRGVSRVLAGGTGRAGQSRGGRGGEGREGREREGPEVRHP